MATNNKETCLYAVGKYATETLLPCWSQTKEQFNECIWSLMSEQNAKNHAGSSYVMNVLKVPKQSKEQAASRPRSVFLVAIPASQDIEKSAFFFVHADNAHAKSFELNLHGEFVNPTRSCSDNVNQSSMWHIIRSFCLATTLPSNVATVISSEVMTTAGFLLQHMFRAWNGEAFEVKYSWPYGIRGLKKVDTEAWSSSFDERVLHQPQSHVSLWLWGQGNIVIDPGLKSIGCFQCIVRPVYGPQAHNVKTKDRRSLIFEQRRQTFSVVCTVDFKHEGFTTAFGNKRVTFSDILAIAWHCFLDVLSHMETRKPAEIKAHQQAKEKFLEITRPVPDGTPALQRRHKKKEQQQASLHAASQSMNKRTKILANTLGEEAVLSTALTSPDNSTTSCDALTITSMALLNNATEETTSTEDDASDQERGSSSINQRDSSDSKGADIWTVRPVPMPVKGVGDEDKAQIGQSVGITAVTEEDTSTEKLARKIGLTAPNSEGGSGTEYSEEMTNIQDLQPKIETILVAQPQPIEPAPYTSRRATVEIMSTINEEPLLPGLGISGLTIKKSPSPSSTTPSTSTSANNTSERPHVATEAGETSLSTSSKLSEGQRKKLEQKNTPAGEEGSVVSTQNKSQTLSPRATTENLFSLKQPKNNTQNKKKASPPNTSTTEKTATPTMDLIINTAGHNTTSTIDSTSTMSQTSTISLSTPSTTNSLKIQAPYDRFLARSATSQAPLGAAIPRLLSRPLLFSYNTPHPLTNCWLPTCSRPTRSTHSTTVICPRCGPISHVRYCSPAHLHADIRRHYTSECTKRQNLLLIDTSAINPICRPVRPFVNITNSMADSDSFERHRQAVAWSYPIDCDGNLDREIDYTIYTDLDELWDHEGENVNVTKEMVQRHRGLGEVLGTISMVGKHNEEGFRTLLARLLGWGVEAGRRDAVGCAVLFGWIRGECVGSGVWDRWMSERACWAMGVEFGYCVPEYRRH